MSLERPHNQGPAHPHGLGPPGSPDPEHANPQPPSHALPSRVLHPPDPILPTSLPTGPSPPSDPPPCLLRAPRAKASWSQQPWALQRGRLTPEFPKGLAGVVEAASQHLPLPSGASPLLQLGLSQGTLPGQTLRSQVQLGDGRGAAGEPVSRPIAQTTRGTSAAESAVCTPA